MRKQFEHNRAHYKGRRGDGKGRSLLTLMACVLLAVAGITAFGVVSAPTPGVAVPGSPGVTAAPTVIFLENFENGMTNLATGAKAYSTIGGTAQQYTGQAGQTYTGSPQWINGERCNGVVLSYNNSLAPLWASTPALSNKCSTVAGVQSYNGIRTLARGMGLYKGTGDDEHIVSGYTECTLTAVGNTSSCDVIGNGPVNGIMFQTTTQIPVTAGHFYTFGVDTVYGNCASPASTTTQASDPQYQFQLINAAGTATNVGGVLNGCRPSPTRAQYTVNRPLAVGAATTMDVFANSLVADAPFQYNSASLGIKMFNASGITNGNDGGFDNIKLLDVTPQLDKAFSPASIYQGQNTTLTYTVTNTSDLLAKNGWHFVDALPAGLTASGPLGGTCVRTAGTVTAGSVDVTGNIAQGSASCTITVTVTSNTPGVYNNSGCVANNGTAIPNCTNNFPTITGLNPPGTAPLTVRPVTDLSITKNANITAYIPGQPITYTVAVHNNGPSDAVNASFTDPLPASITGATWTCAVTVAGASNLPPAGPTACNAASGSGSISGTVRINTGGTLTYTVKGTVAPGTTGVISNTATIVPAAQTAVPNMPGGGPVPVPGSTTLVPTVDVACPPSPGVGCSATVTTPVDPQWTIAKTASINGKTSTGDTSVKPGDTISYTVTATSNRGQITGVVLKDDLADVLDQASFVPGSAVLTIGTAAPVAVANPAAGSTILSTQPFTLPAGQSATLTYKVTVKQDAWSSKLINTVTGTGSVNPIRCASNVTPLAPECSTTHHTPAKVLIEKVGESANATWVPMAGSSWSILSDANGVPGAVNASYTVAPVASQTGQFQLEGIEPGVYWLEETKAPTGFSLLAEPVQFTVAANGAVTLGKGSGSGVVTATDADANGIYLVTVRDVPALKLPESGGIGWWPFSAGGASLLLAALALAYRTMRRTRAATSI